MRSASYERPGGRARTPAATDTPPASRRRHHRYWTLSSDLRYRCGLMMPSNPTTAEAMVDPDEVALEDVRVLADNGMALKCLVARREVWVGHLQVLRGSSVRAIGDYGRLVIPVWLARDLGLVS